MTCERMHQAPINCIPNTNPMICTMPKKKHQSASQVLKLEQNTLSEIRIRETKYNEKTKLLLHFIQLQGQLWSSQWFNVQHIADLGIISQIDNDYSTFELLVELFQDGNGYSTLLLTSEVSHCHI